MRKLIFSGIVSLFCSSHSLFAQNINVPLDSVQTILCKKWEVDYVLMGGMKIGRIPGAAEINYEFNKDKTFLMTSNDPKDKKKGTWSYDPKKKSIKLTLSGGTNTQIVSLKKGELVMLLDANGSVSNDLKDMQMVYKPKIK